MQGLELELAKQLSDEELIARVTCCVKEEREVTARLLVHLGEVEARGLYRDLGFSSMFDYAVQSLHMSESEAWLRLRAARFGREFPTVIAMVARGELHMTALKLLAPVLTASNLELLDKAHFKSKQEIQRLIAAYFPQPDVPSTIRKLPSPKPTSAPATVAHAELASNATHSCIIASNTAQSPDVAQGTLAAAATRTPAGSDHAQLTSIGPHAHNATKGSDTHGTLTVVEAAIETSSQVAQSASAQVQSSALPVSPEGGAQAVAARSPSVRASAIVPLSEDRYKVQFTAHQRLVDMIYEARDLVRNQTPNGDLSSIVERALALLIAERKKQLFAQTNKPRTNRPSKPAAVTGNASAAAGNASAVGGTASAVGGTASAGTASAVACNAGVTTPTDRAERQPSKPNSRHIAHELRRQVYVRDAGRCCFVSRDGTQCRARGGLEFHHIIPFARGGEATLDNICLMCRAHNALAAERDYGRLLVKRHIAERSTAPKLRSQKPSASHESGATRQHQRTSLGSAGRQSYNATGSRPNRADGA